MRKIIPAIFILMIAIVGGCNMQSPVITYKGEQQEANLVSEQLEDLVESENPGKDIDIVMTVNDDNDDK